MNRGLSKLALVGALSLVGARAVQANPHCDKVRARAGADAAMLFAPTLQGQAIRFPTNGVADSKLSSVGSGLQFRGALSFSPLDVYRGTLVLATAEDDCARELVSERLSELVERSGDVGRAAALRQQLAYLDAKLSEADALLAQAAQRFSARTITFVDLDQIRMHHAEFARKRLTTRGELGRVKARLSDEAPHKLEPLKRALLASSVRLEEDLLHLRALDAWQLDMRAGIIANAPVDFFAVLELGFNFGGVARVIKDAAYLRARKEELRQARYELGHAVDVLQEQVAVTAEQLTGERRVVEEQLRALGEMRAVIEKSDAPGRPQAVALLSLQQIALESDCIYLTVLADELGKL